MAVSTRVVVGTDSRGHTTRSTCARSVLVASLTWLDTTIYTNRRRSPTPRSAWGSKSIQAGATNAPLVVVPDCLFRGCVLLPRPRWSQGDGGGCERKRGRGAARGGREAFAQCVASCGSAVSLLGRMRVWSMRANSPKSERCTGFTTRAQPKTEPCTGFLQRALSLCAGTAFTLLTS